VAVVLGEMLVDLTVYDFSSRKQAGKGKIPGIGVGKKVRN
jgi:hypothetical protein